MYAYIKLSNTVNTIIISLLEVFELREKGLTTEENIAIAYTHLEIIFKWALHFGTLAITRFNSKPQLIPQHYKPVYF